MTKNLVLAIGAAMIVSGCASSMHRGVVAMKLDDSTAHVGLRKGEAKVGDHVVLYSDSCSPKLKGEARQCTKKERGHGTVTQVVSDNYLEVKFASGVEFKEGDFVEKHGH